MTATTAPATVSLTLGMLLVGKADTTRRAYLDDLEQFRCFTFAATIDAALSRFRRLTPGRAALKAVEFRGWLARRGASRSQINRALSAVRGATGAAVSSFRNARLELSRSASRQAFAVLLAGASARNAAILHLVEAGVSRREIARVAVADFDSLAGMLELGGKCVALQQDAAAAVRSWLEKHPAASPSSPLFPSLTRPDRALTPYGVGKLLRRAADAVCREDERSEREFSLEESSSGLTPRVPLQTLAPGDPA